MPNQKIEGWEKRLADYIDKNHDEDFKRGVRDCALFAGRGIDIMTGSNTVKELFKPYKNKKQADDLLKSLGYDDLEAVANSYMGQALTNINYAGRGDLVLIKVDHENNPEPEALAIIDLSGKQAVTFGKGGLCFYKPEFWSKAWKV